MAPAVPLHNAWVACTRENASGHIDSPYEQISPEQAMEASTINAASILGVGKTTHINGVLEDGQNLPSLVLVNDFGDINIDASLIAQSTSDIISMVNGCAYCQIGDDLTQTLEAIVSKLDQFD